MTQWFVSNTRLLAMAIVLICVAGIASYQALPRMEDPILTARFAVITTTYPGGTPGRVESLVSKPIERELIDIKEIAELTSMSRAGVSVLVVELNDHLDRESVANAWGLVRERLNAASGRLPTMASKPELEELDAKAHAMLLAIRWDLEEPPSYSILRRLAKRLQERMDLIQGTEKTSLSGDPGEEIIIEIDRQRANSLGLDANQLATMIANNDTKMPAGRLQGSRSAMALEITGNLETKTRISQIPIRQTSGTIVQLGDIATVTRAIPDPAPSKALTSGRPAVVVGVHLRDDYRIDHWHRDAQKVIREFENELPAGITVETIFDQYPYVQSRFDSLRVNFLTGLISVVICTGIWMNVRSAILVGIMLPLNCLFVLPILLIFDIPLHQMSVSGLVIAMGMLVDNAIVVVDKIGHRVGRGLSVRDAAIEGSRYLAIPLLGATLTTVLSFAPIALMPGSTGEFVGSIAQVTIISVGLSYLLSLTVIPGLSLFLLKPDRRKNNPITNPFGRSTQAYRFVLSHLMRFPLLGAALPASIALYGLYLGLNLQDQFFPPADRNQFHIEVDLAANASTQETEQLAQQLRDVMLKDHGVDDVHWFIGESAPLFYYNVASVRSNQPSYAQAIVTCPTPDMAKQAMLRLQPILSDRFPQATISVRQLEQGPPFTAPIEVRLTGPEVDTLQELAADVRGVLARTPGITHTRCEIDEVLAKGEIQVDQTASYSAGYDLTAIARALNGTLDGTVGGSIIEGSESIPVRVRIAKHQRGDLNQIISTEVQPDRIDNETSAISLSAITSIGLAADVASITRIDQARTAEVLGYLPAGVLPSIVQSDFQRRLDQSGFAVPAGYSLTFLGSAGEQEQAIGNLGVYAVIMATSLVGVLVLSMNSFRFALLIGVVCLLSTGFSLLSLAWLGLPFGFMAIVGLVGMLGVAVNDSMLILKSLSLDPQARGGCRSRIIEVVTENSRHVVVTSVTTIAGFFPLYWSGGEFWPPTAVCVAMGVFGSTILALFFVPCCYLLLLRTPESDIAISGSNQS
ncbi:efflux RND transporter permease subunit [Neorhodopirellula pilleata]|uniref:Multidrug resistance protein MdtC n=1 Tax=Neorhodopirellula pilleata TaxID=2714738 RepID=A0A5C6A1B5_9BACT|nr:efflux RND transporter permease subunit [Neorhodopirellula pilleata]TWT93117.1 Multidrug resistance protein MdtC [Neorhodopirellula pilleata]